jgi:hypothetical protein
MKTTDPTSRPEIIARMIAGAIRRLVQARIDFCEACRVDSSATRAQKELLAAAEMYAENELAEMLASVVAAAVRR